MLYNQKHLKFRQAKRWQIIKNVKSKLGLILLLWIFLVTDMGTSFSGAAKEDMVVGDFGVGSLIGWQEKSFKNTTRYELVQDDLGMVLKADSNNSASGMYREIKIDLVETPCVIWSWKVDNVLDNLDETTKSGDDYPARLYVVFSGGLSFWKTHALNYVWSNGRPIGSAWPNAYTKSSINIAVQSGPSKVGQWTRQSRNVRNDYKHFIGGDVKQADAIAIMTDTDNSGSVATAFYGDVRFSSKC
jgi:hypothetical protein